MAEDLSQAVSAESEPTTPEFQNGGLIKMIKDVEWGNWRQKSALTVITGLAAGALYTSDNSPEPQKMQALPPEFNYHQPFTTG